MSKVIIKAHPETGVLVTPYQSNPEFGYMILEQRTISHGIGWSREEVRSVLQRGKTELLNKIAAGGAKTGMAGKIVVREYVESEFPENLKSTFFNTSSDDHEEQIKDLIKRRGKEGTECTLGGERVLRTKFWDPTGKEEDVLVQHDREDGVGAEVGSDAADENANLPE